MLQKLPFFSDQDRKYIREAFWDSLPILFAYFPLSVTWGLLWEQAGFSMLWAALYSIAIYAGTVQFLAVPFLLNPIDPFSFATTTLAIAMRTGVYTCSLWPFLPQGLFRRLLISFLMVDGTYAILLSKESATLKETSYSLSLSLWIYFYWIVGTVLGASIGIYLPSEIADLQFALPCLIAILVVQQVKRLGELWPVLISTPIALVLWKMGVQSWFLPSLALSLLISLLCIQTPHHEQDPNQVPGEIQ